MKRIGEVLYCYSERSLCSREGNARSKIISDIRYHYRQHDTIVYPKSAWERYQR